MLITSQRHTADDLAAWSRAMRVAEAHARLRRFSRQVLRSEEALHSFTRSGSGYVGVSWGKDSVAVADIAERVAPEWPLVWVRVEPIANPDCVLVRDAFLSMYPAARYDEITVWCRRDASGWHASGTLERGFATAVERHGARYVSGIRAEESGIRKLRVAKHGLAGENTCAPLGWWTAQDIWAYLHSRGLPIHPAYACLLHGQLDPGRIRVASLGGKRGQGMGRAEWEARYYAEELAAIRRQSS